ncbi:MAG TPA: MBL fold metallo-hydrolase [Deltaproteobacteria bacterium]|nr:MBL fold metallo-hydrolase [Deltaproteobacteria bacterium]HPR55931.1 MBL fold metallo-hydrolase [Deltaproteobacteria bacterium]HXK47790.1 MBL fold metallo-hydrolase [Deltaproteobacteria bacterium]
MKITAPATLKDDLRLIGDPGFPSAVVSAGKTAMFDTGVSIMAPLYTGSLKRILGARALDQVFLTHSHYDHVGSCGHVRHVFPALQTAGHGLIRDVMKNPRAVATMTALSDIYRQLTDGNDPSTVFIPPEVDLVLEDGDEVDLGKGVTVRVMATPGHTRDSMTFFIEPWGAAVVGEALGVVQLDGAICPEFLTDFKDYLSSAHRIIEASPSIILMPHGPALTGDDARAFLDGVIPAAHDLRHTIEDSLHETGGDIDSATGILFEKLYDPARIGQEMNAFRTNLRAKTACIAKALTPA